MALVLKDRVKESSVSTGTGAIALDGATGAYQAFSTIGNGNTTYYCIAGQTTNEWEVGIGTYTTSTDTLSRDTILASSNSGSIVTFSAGTKDVFITYPSEKAIYEEADGDTLINAGPITVLGPGVVGIPTPYSDTLGRFYGNVDSFQQVYVQNQFNGTDASSDIVAYNNLGDGTNYFVDMGMSGSTYTSATYPIFTPNSAYVYNAGLTTGTGAAGETSELLIGTGTLNSDLVLFTGGVNTTNEAVRVSGANQTIEVQKGVTLNETLDVTGAASFGSTVLLDADPTLALQAATKQYVDNAVSAGLTIHPAVQFEHPGNLAGTYDNGTLGVGATLTNNGTQVVLEADGVEVENGDRVLFYEQTDATENGVYVVTDKGSISTDWVLTRASDADTYAPGSATALGQGSYFYVQNGLTAAGESYVVSTVGTIVFGTTDINFSQFSAAQVYTGTSPIDVTGSVISLTTVPATLGGTGTSTVTTGDLLYGSATNTWSKLPLGAAYKSLVVNGSGTQVEWNAVDLSSSAAVTGSLGPTFGGTGQTTYAIGDTLYSSASNTLAKLSGNTSTTKQYLSQTGTGSASAAPSWATLSAADIGAGTLPATRGGTGQSSYTIGDILYADTTTSLARLADVATGNALISGGLSAAPAWGKIALASAVSGTLPVANGGTGVTSSTGSGSVVLSTSPTLVAPVLGTPASGNLANCTFPTLNQNTTGTAANVTGIVAIANGGTGESTRQAAMDALAGATTSGQYLRGNGTDVVMASIVAGDVPTLNQNTTGNAASATILQTARTIGGVSFNGSANIDLPGVNTAGNQNTSGNAATATTASATTAALTAGTYLTSGGTFNGSTARTFAVDATTTNTASKVVARDASGNFSAGTITAALTGNVTGNVTGSSGSCTGNAATATTATNQSGGTVSASTATVTPNTSGVSTGLTVVNGDITAYRTGGTTGVVYLSTSGTRYLFWDGTNYNLNGAPVVASNITAGGNVTGSSTSCTGNAATATTASNTNSVAGALGTSFTWTASQLFTGNGNTGSAAGIGMNAYSTGGNGAIMAFHRGGVYAINMGLDSDNVIRIGGWSAAANRLQMDMSGNLTMAGNVTAFSDERKKTNWRPVTENFVEKLAYVKVGVYDRVDEELTQVGISAQSLQEVLPEAVLTDNDGFLSVAYGNAAMTSAVELAKELVALKELVKELTAKVEALKAK